MFGRFHLALLAFGAILALAAPIGVQAGGGAGGHVGDLRVFDAWVRAGLPNRPTAGYFQVQNSGGEDDVLVGARSADFAAVEIHSVTFKHTDAGKIATMSPVDRVALPAGQVVRLAPAEGFHLMLFGDKGVADGGAVTLTLVFENAGELTFTAPVLKRGPGNGAHSGHGAAKE